MRDWEREGKGLFLRFLVWLMPLYSYTCWIQTFMGNEHWMCTVVRKEKYGKDFPYFCFLLLYTFPGLGLKYWLSYSSVPCCPPWPQIHTILCGGLCCWFLTIIPLYWPSKKCLDGHIVIFLWILWNVSVYVYRLLCMIDSHEKLHGSLVSVSGLWYCG